MGSPGETAKLGKGGAVLVTGRGEQPAYWSEQIRANAWRGESVDEFNQIPLFPASGAASLDFRS